MISMNTTCALSQCLPVLPTPVFSAQNDTTDVRVPWRFGAKHSVQQPSSPCEEHPTLLGCTETSHAPGLTPSLHESGSSHCRAKPTHQTTFIKAADTHPGCLHRLGCCYQPSNNHVGQRKPQIKTTLAPTQ